MHFKPKVNGILDTLHFQTDVLYVQVPSLLKKSCHLKQVCSHLIKISKQPDDLFWCLKAVSAALLYEKDKSEEKETITKATF